MAESLLSYAIVDEDEVVDYLDTDVGAKSDVMRQIINAITDACEMALRRPVKEREFTDILDGEGSTELTLLRSPCGSITSLEKLDLDGNVVDTYSTSDYWLLKSSYIRMKTGWFDSGIQNYKVVADYGWATVPDDIVLACLQEIARMWRRQQKERDDIVSKTVDGQTTRFDSRDLAKRLRHKLGSHIALVGAA